ncbi:MAG: hypothetical protein AUG51_07860 [Acidobacteria bacterium 13_1_20CM_3_53_8]|nr:MAG: hypothetical protein AUG51_07860 [Acidobacteria bacterium 13_1_20CM_3_53_8]
MTNFGTGSNTLVLNLQQFAFNVTVAPNVSNTQQTDITLTDTGTGHSVTINTTSAQVVSFTGVNNNDNLTVQSGTGDSTARIQNSPGTFTDEVIASDLQPRIQFGAPSFRSFNSFTYTAAPSTFGTNVVTFATQNLESTATYNVSLDNLDTLIIEGDDAVNDSYTITRPAAGQVQVTDTTPAPTVAVTLSKLGGGSPPSVIVKGLGGNDQLNINVGAAVGSDVIPNPITFDGGAGNDLVDVFGASPTAVDNVTHTPGPNLAEGHLRYDNASGTQLMNIDFYNTEAAVDLVAATKLTAKGTDAANAINYSAVQIIGAGGRVSVDSLAPIEFSNKTNLIINALGGGDTININNQAGRPPGLVGITIDGGDPTSGSDTLIINGISGGMSGTTSDELVVTPTATGSGTVAESASAGATSQTKFAPLSFINLEHLILVGQSADLDQITVAGTSVNDTFDISQGPTPDSSSITGFSSSFSFVPVQFSGFTTLNLNGNDGSDSFKIVPSPAATINVFGGNPTPPASPGDSLSVNTTGTTGFSLSNSNTPSGQTGSFTFSNRMPVNFQQIETLSPLVVSPTTINAFEGVPLNNVTVATFNAGAIAASNFSATINWGDGTASSSGVIASNGSGAFTVKGSHTYLEEGSYNILVKVTDLVFGTTQEVTSTAIVADAPLVVAPLSAGANQTFSGVGGNNTSVTPGTANKALTDFETAIGGVNNGANPPPQATGFRVINWDAVALDGTDFGGNTTVIVPNNTVGIPTNRFQARGVSFDRVHAVSGDGFVTANPGVAGQFPAFSPTRTFSSFNNNVINVKFVLPSTANTPPIQAVSRGFGAIFLDVETPNTTSIELFSNGTSLGKFFVPVGTSGQAEFFGVLFQNPVVTNVRIELGNATLFSFDGTTVTSGPADNPGGGVDLAVTDDFAYAEPTAVSTGININAIAGAPVTARVASFTDTDPNGQLSDYTATIDWGDSTTSAGTITPNASGGLDVTGTHTYVATGTFTVTTSIRDTGGSSISAKSTATVSGQPSLSIGNATVIEGNSGSTNAAFTVTLSAASTQAVTVDYVTSDGTATAPSDYDAQSGTLVFTPGQTTKTINIAVKGDTLPELNETFFVTLFNPVNATIATAQGTGTITDDDESGTVQFGAATATVAENAGNVSITVTRGGDTSGATSVNYETSDITAQQKSDYIFGSGVINFGAGETSKTIQILLVNDVYVEGPETFKITLNSPSGNFIIGAQNSIAVTITDDDSVAPTTNPIDDANFFVRQQYLDFLNREPDASGLAFWSGKITACGSNAACINQQRVLVSAAFFQSAEFQDTGGFVIRVYKAAFDGNTGIRPNYLEFMRDRGKIVVGSGQDASKTAFVNNFITRPEFLLAFPLSFTPQQYVDALNANTGNSLTQGERDALVNGLINSTETRATVLQKVADNALFKQRQTNSAFVQMEYYGYLRRDLDLSGFNFWLNILNTTGNFRSMVCAFINSAEYQQRFSPVVTHNDSGCGAVFADLVNGNAPSEP